MHTYIKVVEEFQILVWIRGDHELNFTQPNGLLSVLYVYTSEKVVDQIYDFFDQLVYKVLYPVGSHVNTYGNEY